MWGLLPTYAFTGSIKRDTITEEIAEPSASDKISLFFTYVPIQ